MSNMNFDDIRSYNDAEIPEKMEKLVHDKQFMNLLSTIFPLLPKEVLKQKLLKTKTVKEFQINFDYPFLKGFEATKTAGIEFYGLDTIDKEKSYLYLSNHRDILLDSMLFCFKLIENNMDTVEIAIGNNLLVYPFIEDFMRVNKSFIVHRNLGLSETMRARLKLSAYIRQLIKTNQDSVWIAQREGRTKDSNDLTQEALLRMLSFSGDRDDFYKNIVELNICPLSISYEYDPTDFLKAKEFQLKRDNPEHKKGSKEDLINMYVGLMGYRGKVEYRISGSINEELQSIAEKGENFKEQLSFLAKAIDRVIHKNYTIYNVNKIAYDLLRKEKRFVSDYTSFERSEFSNYVERQILKINIKDRDSDFLRTKILEIYANPLINHLKEKETNGIED